MKQFFITLSIIVPIFSFAQPQIPTKEGKAFYEEIDSLPSASKTDLYNKSKVWFVNTFNNANAVIQMDDKDAGIIMGKGITSFDAGNIMTGPIRQFINYTININLKDNKCRIQVYDIYVSNGNAAAYTAETLLKYPKMNKKKIERINNDVQGTIASFKVAITKKSEDTF
jgi:hypothetical protein